jgi:hypothetical protein
LILGNYVCIGQCIEQRAFARIGVTDQCNDGHGGFAALAAILAALLANIFQLALEKGDAATDFTTVNFQLRFTWAANTHAAACTARAATRLAGQMRPGASQSGQTIFVLR